MAAGVVSLASNTLIANDDIKSRQVYCLLPQGNPSVEIMEDGKRLYIPVRIKYRVAGEYWRGEIDNIYFLQQGEILDKDQMELDGEMYEVGVLTSPSTTNTASTTALRNSFPTNIILYRIS